MKKKKIIVPTIGQIPLLGGIIGPILKPFLLDVETIRHLITVGCDVEEVFKDTENVKLTLYNYDKNNYVPKKKRENTQEQVMMQTNDVMVEEKAPEDGVTTTKEQPKNNGVDKGVQDNQGNRKEGKRNPKQFYGGKQKNNK